MNSEWSREGRACLALVDGRANDELRRFFASVFGVLRSAIQVVAGEHTRNKRVLIACRDGASIVAVIEQALAATKPPSC